MEPGHKVLLDNVELNLSRQNAPRKRKAKLDDDDFNFRFNILEDYVKTYGHALVPQNTSHLGFKLGGQVSRWRSSYLGSDHRLPLSEKQIEYLESVHPSWCWSGADARSGVLQVIPDDICQLLLEEKPDHDIHTCITLGLYFGLRCFETKQFETIELQGIKCFLIPKSRDYEERYIPIINELGKFSHTKKSDQSLLLLFTRLLIIKSNPNIKSITNLHITFRNKLSHLGLEREMIDAISGYNRKFEWNAANLKVMANAIRKINY